jgi:osmotically-inducible protein OsmY
MKEVSTNAPRSDADIFLEARRALDRSPNVPATVRVHVNKGHVTLTGTVHQPSERSEAEDALRGVRGIRRVENNITVARVVSAEGFEPPDERA